MKLLIIFILATFISAFTIVAPSTTATSTCLALHPDQAKELEQCAFDHMIKEQAEQASMKKDNKKGNLQFGWYRKIFASKEMEKPKAEMNQ